MSKKSEEKIEEIKPTEETNQKQYFVVFISGNTDLSEKQFITYYLPILNILCEQSKKENNIHFLVSDDDGCAIMTQLFLKNKLTDKTKVSVFGLEENPKNYADSDFVYVGGFKTIEERDAAMTAVSNKDIHVVLEGKGRSSVEHNAIRRVTPEYDYLKYTKPGYNTLFWVGLYGDALKETYKEESENKSENKTN